MCSNNISAVSLCTDYGAPTQVFQTREGFSLSTIKHYPDPNMCHLLSRLQECQYAFLVKPCTESHTLIKHSRSPENMDRHCDWPLRHSDYLSHASLSNNSRLPSVKPHTFYNNSIHERLCKKKKQTKHTVELFICGCGMPSAKCKKRPG